MPYRFIIFTWLVIMPIHTLNISFALAVTNVIHVGNMGVPDILFDRVAAIAILSVPFSMPGLLGLLILVWIARAFIYDRRSQFTFISSGCMSITIFCYFLLESLLNLDFKMHEYLPLVIASVAAVFLSLCITRKHYYS